MIASTCKVRLIVFLFLKSLWIKNIGHRQLNKNANHRANRSLSLIPSKDPYISHINNVDIANNKI